MKIYPIIKPTTWAGFQQTEQLFLNDPMLDDPTVELSLPKIVYAVDQDDSMIYVEENFFEGKSDDDVKQKAFADLRQHLAEEDWQSLDISDKCEGLRVLMMQTSYYGSEVLLLKERMQEASSILGSSRLLACTPYRGLIFVLPFDEENKQALSAFLGVCYENYNNPEGDQLSDTIWALIDGEVKGVMGVNQEFKDYHEKTYGSDSYNISEDNTEDVTEESTTDVPINANAIKQFTNAQIAIGAFIATPLAGFLLVGSNLKGIGKVKQGNLLSLIGVILMPMIVYLYTLIPPIPYEKLFPAASAVLSVMLSKVLVKPVEGFPIERKGLLALLGNMAASLAIVFLMVFVMVSIGIQI